MKKQFLEGIDVWQISNKKNQFGSTKVYSQTKSSILIKLKIIICVQMMVFEDLKYYILPPPLLSR